jgi:hypothetical protein
MTKQQEFPHMDKQQVIGFPAMETERLILRSLHDEDVDALRDI